jgi:polysaccharide export outer membrane protein
MKPFLRFLAALVTVVLLLTPSLDAQDSSSDGLAPGDQLRISVWKAPEFSGDFTISANGSIGHPLYRDIQAAGVPLSVVEDRIRTFLQRYQTNPQFFIQPLVRIVVAGEVRTPNVFSVSPETTIAQAIAIAGGGTDRARLSRVTLIRERQEVKIDLTRPDSDAAGLKIRSGDQVIVGRTSNPAISYIGPVASTIAAVAAVISILSK